MSKKGDLFMLGLDVFFLLAVLLVLWKVGLAFQPKDDALGAYQAALLSTYDVADEMLLHLDVAARNATIMSLPDTARRGVRSDCGTYAGYQAWTTKDRTCFPSIIDFSQAIGQRIETLLASKIDYPGFPSDIRWDIKVDETPDGLSVKGLTQDMIELPIYLIEGPKYGSRDLLVRSSAARSIQSTFPKDTDLEATTRPSQARNPRTESITTILIASTHTKDVSDALYAYDQRSQSVHYLIDRTGAITQLVPEGQETICDGCDRAIVISLVNDAPTDPPCDQSRLLLPMGDWCADCASKPALCWEKYPAAQQDALLSLVQDVRARHNIPVEQIRLEDEIASRGDSPGPALWYESGRTQRAAFQSFLGDAAKPPKVTQDTSFEPTLAIPVVWPTQETMIGGCFQDDTPFVRIQTGTDSPVHAIADGIVETIGDGTLTIRHSPSLISSYKGIVSRLKQGESIKRGNTIGLATGQLELRIYQSKESFTADKPTNPLCIFPEDILKKTTLGPADSCNKYREGGVSKSNPLLQAECHDTQTMLSEGCFASTITIDPSGDKQIAATKQQLESQAGLLDAIQRAAAAQEMDPRLILAIITQESGGRPDLVSSTGCAGLGQFCLSTAKDTTYAKVFDQSKLRQCNCQIEGKSCDKAHSSCASIDEPRFDAFASAQAIAIHLKGDYDKLSSYDDQALFTIASYNAGRGLVEAAIERTGSKNPPWEEVATKIDESLIAQVYSRSFSAATYQRYYGSEAQRERKVKEIIGYVQRVGTYYLAYGGSSAGTFNTQVCGEDEVSAKKIGNYRFTPSFDVELKGTSLPIMNVVRWAQQTYETCDGSGDNRACLAGRKTDEFPACAQSEGVTYVASQFRSWLQDCQENKQDSCYCQWVPPRMGEVAPVLRLYGDTPQLFVDGAPLTLPPTVPKTASFARTPSSEPVAEGLELSYTWSGSDPEYKVREYSAAQDNIFGVSKEAQEADGFYAMKKNGTIVWTPQQPTDMPACGEYKVEHQVCAEVTSNGQKIPVRFALTLKDDVPPAMVAHAAAIRRETPEPILVVTFLPSSSADISYYRVGCDLNDSIIVNGRVSAAPGLLSRPVTAQLSATLACDGTHISIRPYDLSGNPGEVTTVPIEDGSRFDGNLLDAVVQYYSGVDCTSDPVDGWC